MKSIELLIKLHKRELDELQKTVAKHESEKEQLIDYYNKMEDDLAQEYEVAVEDVTMGAAFANYRNFIRDRQKTITKAVRDLEKKIEILKLQITEKFSELKKYEILEARKLQELLHNEKAKETRQLDEMAVSSYLNNQEDA